MPYTPSSWYPNYPSHHMPGHPNSQFLSPPPGQGMDLADSAAASFYNAHHHMMHQQSSPDWNGETFGIATPNSQIFSQGTPSSSTHLSPQSISSQQNTSSNSDGLSAMVSGVPPSPPTTVNSACSEMSSPGVGSTNNLNTSMGSDEVGGSDELADDKAPFGWMKKPSYATIPNPGM